MRRPLALSIFITCLLILFFCGKPAFAANPKVHISPKPKWIGSYSDYNKKPPSRTIRDGYFYALSEQQINVEKKSEYFHYVREIVSGTGIQNGSQISVSFDPSYERLDFHEIIVWRNNKPHNRLKLSAFWMLADEQDFSKFIYQGSYSANIILPDIRKGDRIEYAFTLTGRNPIFKDKFCRSLYFQGNKPIAHQYISIVSSSSRKLNMKLFNKASKPVIADAYGMKRYTWENFQVQPVIENDNQPSWYNPYDYVQISEYNSWQEVAGWALKINHPAYNIKGRLGKLIAWLKVKYANDKPAYFRTAVKIVQDEVRYMGIEIGEYSHRANRPERVYSQRYGDCKDKSLLLVSILRAGGIDADMVLVNTDMNDKIDQLIPASNAFDHAVVVATLNSKQVWIDATISNQGGDGTDIYFPAYGKGLVLKPGTTTLTAIPISKAGKAICEEKFTIKDENSKVRLDVKTTYTRNQADRERDRFEAASMAETEKSYLDYYSKIYPKIAAIDSIKVVDDLHKNQFTTIESYLITDFYKRDSLSGKLTADFYADYISQELPTISNQAKTPVAINFPYATDYTIKVVLANGWNVASTSSSIKRDAYNFASDYSASGDTLSLHYQFAFLKDHVPVNKLDEFKKDINQLKEDELSYGVGIPMDNPPFVLNLWMIGLVVFLSVLFAFVGILIYRIETPGIVFNKGASFTPIGGWLIFILIELIITPISVGLRIFNGEYFSMSKWNTLTYGSESAVYRGLLLFEIIGYTAIICYSVFCLVLLLNKRDILPKVIIAYYVFCGLFFITDHVLALSAGRVANDPTLNTLVISTISATVLISYFRKSERVEQTFIVPYPANNCSYEE